MPQALLAIFTQIASVIGGGINGALGMMTSLISKGFQSTIQFHKEGIAFAREVGLSAREAQAYTQVLTERTEKLALKYGVTADAIKEVQRGIIDATGKQYMLNEAEAERQVQINKLVGAGTANQFTEQMMNHMGAQLSTVQGAVSKAYATAAKSGLNAAKFSKEVAKNLSLANKLSFRDGVNGIIRMTALSEKLGFNLQSVENAANKFMELDSAIESSAQLQMLGGAASAYGGNPLEMAYEANYDPEAFTERMTKMLGGYAQFDAKTGMANVNGMNRDFVKNIAQAMGISMDEAMSIAKKQAEIKYKEGAYAPELDKLKNQEQRDFILNKSYVDPNTRQLMINDIHGKAHNISENGIDGIIDELQKFDNMSEKDIMQRQAETLTDIQAQIDGIGASFAASIAKSLNQYIPGATTAIKNFAKEVQPSVVEIGRNVGEIVKTALDWLKDNKETIKNVAKGVFGVTAWLTKHWPLLIALWAGKKLLGASLPSSTTVGGKLASKALGGIWKGAKAVGKGAWKGAKAVGKGAWKGAKAVGSKAYDILGKGGANHSWKQAKNYARNAFRMTNGNVVRKGLHGVQSIWKNSKALRASVKGGAAILGVAGNMATDYLVDKGKIKKGGVAHYGAKMTSTAAEYGALGATIGSIIPGLGTAVGGAVGAAVGSIKVAYDTWKSLPQNADKDFIDYAKSVGDSIVEGGKEAFNWAKEKVGPALSAVNKDIQERGGYLSVAFNVITAPIRFFISAVEGIAKLIMHPIETIKNIWDKLKKWWNSDDKLGALWDMAKDTVMGEKHASGGIVGGNSYSGDKVLAGLNSGEMVLNKNQQARLFKFINNDSDVISTALNGDNGIKTRPFGENSFRMIPRDISVENGQKVSEITVKDVNLNVNGTIKLDAGNFAKNIDINQLLNDSAFVSSLKEIIKNSINNDMNGGRFMNDNATLRGSIGTTTYWGR